MPDATKEAVVRHGVYYAQRVVRMRAAVQSRAAEMGLVLPSDKAGRLVMSVIMKEKAHAQLHAHGSLGVIGRIRRPAPSSVARNIVLLPSTVPAAAPPATSTVLPLPARAAGRSSGFAPVVVPAAPAQPLAPPVAAVVAAAARGGAGVETPRERKTRKQREKRNTCLLYTSPSPRDS